jgi:hypothetical protein
MLISFHKDGAGDFEKDYIDARRKLDVLCGIIISGRISRGNVEKIYAEIKQGYFAADPEKEGLFRMIYDSRINRLCDQFCPE